MIFPDKDLMLDMMRDKKQVMRQLLDDFNLSVKHVEQSGLRIEAIESGRKIATEKMLIALAKSVGTLWKIQSRMVLFMIVYSAGGNMESDAAKTAMALGANGHDVLGQMLKNKVGGL